MMREEMGYKSKGVQIKELTVNHRSTQEIVMLSNVFLELLGLFFPTTIDEASPTSATHTGPLPAYMSYADFLAKFVGVNQQVLSADQIVLTPRADTFPSDILKHCPDFQKRCSCATPATVKGLEYDDVFIFGWFETSCHSALWDELVTTMRRDGKGLHKKQLAEIWMDHAHAPLHIEMKHLFIAISRARFGLVFVEPKNSVLEWLISTKKLTDGLSTEARDSILRRRKEGQDEQKWLDQARRCFEAEQYLLAFSSYNRCGELDDEDKEKHDVSGAYSEMDSGQYKKAGDTFARYDIQRPAAECFARCSEYAKAADAFEKIEQWIFAAENARSCAQYKRAGNLFSLGEDYRNSMKCYQQVEEWDAYEGAAKKGFESDRHPWWAKKLAKNKRYEAAARLYEECGEYGLAGRNLVLLGNSAKVLSEAYELFLKAGMVSDAKDAALKAEGKGALQLWNRAAMMLDGKGECVLSAGSLWRKVAFGLGETHPRYVEMLESAATHFRSRDDVELAEVLEIWYKNTKEHKLLVEAESCWKNAKKWDKHLDCLKILQWWEAAARNREMVKKWAEAATFWKRVSEWRNQGDCLIRARDYDAAACAFRNISTPFLDINDCARLAATGEKTARLLTHLNKRVNDAETFQEAGNFLHGKSKFTVKTTLQAVSQLVKASHDTNNYDAIMCTLFQLDPSETTLLKKMRACDWCQEHSRNMLIVPKGLCAFASRFFASSTLEVVEWGKGKTWIWDSVVEKINDACVAAMHAGNSPALVDAAYIWFNSVDDKVIEAYWKARKDDSIPNCFRRMEEAAIVLNGIKSFSNVVRAALDIWTKQYQDAAGWTVQYIKDRQHKSRTSDMEVARLALLWAGERDGYKFLLRCGVRYVAVRQPDMWALLGEWKYVASTDPEIELERKTCPTGKDELSSVCRCLWQAKNRELEASKGTNGKRAGESSAQDEEVDLNAAISRLMGYLQTEPLKDRLRVARCISMCLPCNPGATILAVHALLVFHEVAMTAEISIDCLVHQKSASVSAKFSLHFLLSSVEDKMLQRLGLEEHMPLWRVPEGQPSMECPDAAYIPKVGVQNIIAYNCQSYVRSLAEFIHKNVGMDFNRIDDRTLAVLCDCLFGIGIDFKPADIAKCIGHIFARISPKVEHRATKVCAKLQPLVEDLAFLKSVLGSSKSQVQEYCKPMYQVHMMVYRHPEIEWDTSPTSLDEAHAVFVKPLKGQSLDDVVAPLASVSWEDIHRVLPKLCSNEFVAQLSIVCGCKFLERELDTGGGYCIRDFVAALSQEGNVEGGEALGEERSARGMRIAEVVKEMMTKTATSCIEVVRQFLSPEMILRLHEYRTPPESTKMDAFGLAAISYGKSILKCYDFSCEGNFETLWRAYAMFLLADCSLEPHTFKRSKHPLSTRQVFWNELAAVQKEPGKENRNDILTMEKSLEDARWLFRDIAMLLSGTKDNPMDAMAETVLFRSPPLDLLLNSIIELLHCEEVGKNVEKTTKKVEAKNRKQQTHDVSLLFGMTDDLLRLTAQIASPDLLRMILDSLRSTVDKKSSEQLVKRFEGITGVRSTSDLPRDLFLADICIERKEESADRILDYWSGRTDEVCFHQAG